MSVKTPYLSFKTKTLQSLKTPAQDNYIDLKIINSICQFKPMIFLAHSESRNKHFVLKAYHPSNSSSISFYYNEARFIQVSHPNIIQILDAKSKSSLVDKRIQDSPYIIMELAPYGNFAELVMKESMYKDEKLCRTYFHQLIDGVEYLHYHNIAHMDLKLGNLLLGEDYLLKIIDFEFAYRKGDSMIFGNGTKNFRAPEIKNQRAIDDYRASDMYSIGIILFILMTGGFPYDEETKICGYDLYDLLLNNPSAYWTAYERCMQGKVKLSEELKVLIEGLIKQDPKKRMSISDIKSSAWYQMETYTQEEIRNIMSKRARSCLG
mgnify:CR=1 FL=1